MSKKTTKYVSAFGKNLAALRKGKHLTQPELAEKIGATREMVSYLETRAENPTMEQIIKFANFFDISTDELLYDVSDVKHKPGPKSTLERQIEELGKLPKSKQQTVSDMLTGLLQT